jgi:hypothetical protein
MNYNTEKEKPTYAGTSDSHTLRNMTKDTETLEQSKMNQQVSKLEHCKEKMLLYAWHGFIRSRSYP